MDTQLILQERAQLLSSLMAMGITSSSESVAVAPLAGGVSCDVYRVEVPGREPMVLKRALPTLRVAAEWHAPPERSGTEVAWLEFVRGIETRWVPKVLGEDPANHLFAMEFLPPEDYPVWKAKLATGHSDPAFAAKVGAALARIHAASADNAEVAAAFANDAQFYALRLEPYLLFTAARHPALASAIRAEAERIAAARIALMQGDISPKNILCGREGPVFLDAETACYGDPAFDLAFCLNHFLLKSVWHPECTKAYAAAFAALKKAYLAEVTWEGAAGLDRRIAKLLPMLFLARVDGKSPVEYLTDEGDRSFVRAAAIQMILEPPLHLDALAEAFFPIAAERVW